MLAAGPLFAATRFDPRLRFRSISTEHFVIYFHHGEERLAARVARIAEETRLRLQPTLGVPMQPKTHVVLVDQTELANGWATPIPYNTIIIGAAAPSGSELIGNTDNWLELVFAHEYTHIVHLDRSRGWSRAVRAVFRPDAARVSESLSADMADRRAGNVRGEQADLDGAIARRRLSRDRA